LPHGTVEARQRGGAQPLAPIVDGERAIEVEMDIDPRAGIAAAARSGPKLQRALAELKGVVVGDGAAVLEGADAREVGGRRPPRGLWVRWRLGEAGVVPWPEAVKDPLRVGAGGGLREAEFDDQAILEGAKEALDPALALGRGGGEPADAQLLERAPDLRGRDVALQLLRHALRGLRLAMKDPMPIGVGRGGQAIATDELAQEEEIAVRIFLQAKDAGKDLARGVVDGGVEDEPWAAVLEPGVVAAVHLDKEAGLRHALAAPPMLGGPTAARTADASAPQEPLHGLAGHVEVLPLRQEFRKVVVVHADVRGARQDEDAGPDGVSHAPSRRAPAVPVRKRGGALLPPAREHSADVTK